MGAVYKVKDGELKPIVNSCSNMLLAKSMNQDNIDVQSFTWQGVKTKQFDVTIPFDGWVSMRIEWSGSSLTGCFGLLRNNLGYTVLGSNARNFSGNDGSTPVYMLGGTVLHFYGICYSGEESINKTVHITTVKGK